jgi:hypothetical protein
MKELILHPSHLDYCNECIYHGSEFGNCLNEDYNKNIYKVNCVWHYCPYKRKEKKHEVCINEGTSERRGL